MMFYPLVKMQESEHVYAEHFHRLWGLLVGISVMALLVHVHLVETRTWVKRLAIIILLAVIIQGILGGTRVTENNVPLAIVHGVFGQAVFATIVCMAACRVSMSGVQPPMKPTFPLHSKRLPPSVPRSRISLPS